MNAVYVFPGQGSQRRGMGDGLFAKHRALVAQADACLGYSLEELCLRDPNKVLNQTEYTQPALYAVSALTYLDRLAAGEPAPSFVAGHSLGEYCALFAAGAFDFVTGLQLVRERGALMSRAPKGAMAAVINLEIERVRAVLDKLPHRGLDLANINSRKQCIISGVHEQVTAADTRAAFVDAGASFVPLNVSAAFHSRCMRGVQDEFARYLARFTLAPLTRPVIANYTARPYPTTGYAECLIQQISNPVRWFESMSWLLHRGHKDFVEVGPGNVLTKLTGHIVADPMPIVEAPAAPVVVAVAPVVAAPAVTASRGRARVFMYAGQGTQYPQMGRALYQGNPAFRAAMDRCDAAYRARVGSSMLAAIYDDSRGRKELDDLLVTHPAIYSLGYSLTEALADAGFRPNAVLGHSLGEYVAATVAGALAFDDGLELVIAQARLAQQRVRGGMLSVLGPPSLVRDRRDLFEGIALAGINYAGNFVVSGEHERLVALQAALDQQGVIAVRLPVRHAFHSPLVEPMRTDALAQLARTPMRAPRLPIYSATRARALAADDFARWPAHLWDVVREPIQFDALITAAFPDPARYYFVDLSASGSFASFFKHGHPGRFRSAPAINQFGNNAATLTRLCDELRGA